MRIVMVCDDVTIDRRILAEAETLVEAGHEVIVLAALGTKTATHEIIGMVKVERIQHSPVCLRERLILKLTRRVARGLMAAARCIGSARPAGALALKMRWLGRAARAVSTRLRTLTPHEQHVLDRIIFYRPDCIHAHDLPQLRVAAHASRRLGVPLVYDAHEYYTEIAPLTPRDRETLRRREGKYLPNVDLPMTVNALIAEELGQRHGMRIEVVENAVDPPPGFDPCAHHDRFREGWGIPKDHIILLYQGWLAMYRGLLPLIHAMPRVADHIHLFLMGYGADVPQLKALTQSLGVSQRVHFADAVSQSELLWWTASADVGLIPYQPVDRNILLCSPNKLYEFIQAGLPMLSNDLPFLRRVIEAGGFGLVRKLDSAETFAAAITECCRDREQMARFKQAILMERERYTWRHESKKFLELYQRVLTHTSRESRQAA